MRIYSLSGNKRVGKDTVADILANNHGFTKYSFADHLKDICCDVFEMPKRYFFDDEYKDSMVFIELLPETVDKIESITGLCGLNHEVKLFSSPREALQYVGTDLVRSVNNTYWIDFLIGKLKNATTDVVVTDARFKNERESLKKIKSTNILVTRNIKVEDTHISENDLGSPEDYDVIIKNDGRLTELERDIELWMTHVRNKQV